MTQSAGDVVHYVVIKVHSGKYPTSSVIQFYKWDGLRWELRNKYDWYFKYRAALAQVQNPRSLVYFGWGNNPATGKTVEQIKHDRVMGKRRTITKYRNLLRKAEQEWNELFPIYQDPLYKKVVAKIERLERELAQLL